MTEKPPPYNDQYGYSDNSGGFTYNQPGQTSAFPPQTGANPPQTGAYPPQTGAFPPQTEVSGGFYVPPGRDGQPIRQQPMTSGSKFIRRNHRQQSK